jgi:hypothetical protein
LKASRSRLIFPKSVEGCYGRAQKKRRCVDRGEFLGDGNQRRILCDHDFSVSAIGVSARDCLIGAADKAPQAAPGELKTGPSQEAHANALVGFPSGHSRAYCIDAAYNLVPGHARKGDSGKRVRKGYHPALALMNQ